MRRGIPNPLTVVLVASGMACTAAGPKRAEYAPQVPYRAPECKPLAPTSDRVPPTPSRQDVIEAMRVAMEQARSCSDERAIVSIQFTFDSNGCLKHHEVALPENAQTTTDEPAVWSCVVDKTSIVQFAPFAQEVFKVRFPFRVGPR